MEKIPFITIVMPIRNEEPFIEETLRQILNQDYLSDRFEVIVADGMSKDRTRELVMNISKSHPNVYLFDNQNRLPSSGRNVGFKNGKGDIFIVIDGHCFIPTNQLFKNIVYCFEKSGAQCLGRPQPLDPPGLTDFQRAVALARASKIGHSGKSFIYSNYEGYVSPVSNGAIYKKEIFEKVGYVDEDFDACEDVEFNYRVEKAGFKAYMNPSLTVKYYPRGNLKELFKQMKRYGMGRFKFIKKHPEVFNFDMLMPPAFVVGLFLLILFGIIYILSFLYPIGFPRWLNIASIGLSILYGFYFLLIISESLRIASNDKFRYLKHLPSIFFIVHFGLGFGFLNELMRCISSKLK